MIKDIGLTIGERRIAFKMDLEGDNICDLSTVYCLNHQGACEPEVCHLMARAIRPGDTVADIGANVGWFTMFMSQLVGPTGAVTAFEPCPQNVEKLKANLKLNSMEPRIVTAPLWSSVADVTLWMSNDGGLASLGRSPGALGRLQQRSTTLAAEYDTLPRFIKIDAEGSEYRILMGAKHLNPAVTRYVVCELNEEALGRMGSSSKLVREYMAKRGYDMFLLSVDGHLPALVPSGTELRTTASNLNVLFSTVYWVAEAWPVIEVRQNAAA